MSADSSRESGLSRRTAEQKAPPTTDSRASRYQRAAERTAETAQAQPPRPEPPRSRDDRRERAAEQQARDDRRERGRSKILNDVAALLGGEEDAAGKSPRAGRERASEPPPRDDASAQPGRATDPAARPGLELDADADEDSQASKPRGKGGKTLAEFAAEHEIEAADVFKVLVGFEEGGPEPVTIGELKDAFKAGRDLDAERDQFEDWRVESQNEVLQARTELELTVQALAAEFPPEAMARATGQAAEALKAQVEKSRAQLTEWFPEWRDAQVKIRDREDFTKLMATYGFTAAEVSGVIDARLIKFGIDAMRLMNRYKRLREGERERRPSTQPPARARPKAATKNATDRAHEIAAKGDKVGAVAALLGG